ncbi:MAG: hydantoinase/oxoprolinase family protein [Gemmatimonadales bacterium]|nr:hydantoinase/oxoprolinase family protein [Gemmatimonadales bacterium]
MTAAPTLGWDIGGVHTKLAAVVRGRIAHTASAAYELQRAPASLPEVLRRLADGATAAGVPAVPRRHAITLTAELSQRYRTKAAGVAEILEAIATAFPTDALLVYGTDGGFHAPEAARAAPLVVAAANWHATATLVARHHPDAILVDIGSTTTDVVAVAGGVVRAEGRTDPDRLASGELAYTGMLRTPVEAIVRTVPWRGQPAAVSAEGWALTGDAHLWRGALGEDDCSWPAPDGRPMTRAFAAERLLRVVCADRTMADDAAVDAIAGAIAAAQVAQVKGAIAAVRRRWPALTLAVVTGLGAVVAAEAAQRAGLRVARLADTLGADAATIAPAAAVALLLDEAPSPMEGAA